MTIAEYIEFTKTTAVYPPERSGEYLILGLLSEEGEVAALLKREIRDGVAVDRDNLRDEYGDCLWYLAQLFPRKSAWDGARGAIKNAHFFDYLLVGMIHSAFCASDTSIAYFYRLLEVWGFTLEEVMDANVAKLSSRKERGVLHGQGGER